MRMWAVAVVVGALLGRPTLAAAQRTATVEATLQRAHERYLVARAAGDAAALAVVDGELRAVRARRPFVGFELFRPGYEVLGLQRAVFDSGLLAYDGRVLREAHAVDPHSAARPLTLFSTIFPKGEAWVDVPDVEAAAAYLWEFPDGPFAADVHRVLADFHDDLFKAVMSGERLADYKRACFAPFMTTDPPHLQARQARRAAMAHYQALLAMRPDRGASDTLHALSTGASTGWHYCGD